MMVYEAMARVADPDRLRQALVDGLRRSRAVRSAPVERAFRAVPRHLFLPHTPAEDAYRDDAIVTHWDPGGLPSSSSSQPAMMAIMLEQLDLRPGHRVLEVGAGTGYNAAVMREITGPGGRVVTMDIQPEVARDALKHLTGAGYHDITVVAADGGFGHPPEAPYDRIIVTASASDIPPHWREQLVEGGALVVPLRLHTQCLSTAFVRQGAVLRSRGIEPCGFMHLRGPFGAADPVVRMGEGLFLSGPRASSVPVDLLARLLAQPPRRVGGLIVPVNSFGLGGGLGVYLAMEEPGVVDIFTSHPERWGFHALSGLLDPREPSLCLVRRDAVVVYGGDGAADRLGARAAEWVERGRPGLDRLRIEAWPAGGAPDRPDGWRLRRRWSDVVVWFEA
jgi:protein-L-isoaspartate(D-aspartate) O-methyltransferase